MLGVGDVSGFHHISVMANEVIEALEPWNGGVFVDGTLGGAGHSRLLLQAAAERGVKIKLIGFDRDPEALAAAAARLEEFGDQVELVQSNYRHLADVLEARQWPPVNGVLVDAGVSSHQLDTPERGFSFQNDGPLDMRMGPDAQTVAELIDRTDIKGLATILGRYGEVRGAGRMARRIKEARQAGQLETTAQLAALCGPRRHKERIHPATQVFQGLRIAANDELGGLEELVGDLGRVLAPGGRAAFISFHSLEDRIVKQGLRALVNPCTCPPGLPICACGKAPEIKTLGKMIRPSQAEVDANPRSRSAKLRVAERL